MSNIDKAIECLKAKIAISSISADNKNYQISMTIGETKELVSVLESKHEQGEFTNKVRKFIKKGEKRYNANPDAYLANLAFHALQACDHIDRLTAELEAEKKQVLLIEKQCQENGNRAANLQAELNQNKFLLEHGTAALLKAKDEAIGLLNSMVISGEKHSDTSRKIVEKALKG